MRSEFCKAQRYLEDERELTDRQKLINEQFSFLSAEIVRRRAKKPTYCEKFEQDLLLPTVIPNSIIEDYNNNDRSFGNQNPEIEFLIEDASELQLALNVQSFFEGNGNVNEVIKELTEEEEPSTSFAAQKNNLVSSDVVLKKKM